MAVPITSHPGDVRAIPSRAAGAGWTWAALGVASVALAGSLLLSLGMGLKACPLCFYQRTFVMGVVAVLGIGLFTGMRPAGWLSLLTLPLTVGGLVVAIFHEYLEQVGRLECPGGIFGWGTAPQQSLVGLAVLLVLLCADALRSRQNAGFQGAAMAGAVVLGVLLAVAAILSAPPLPAPPAKPYEQALDICRPPYGPQ